MTTGQVVDGAALLTTAAALLLAAFVLVRTARPTAALAVLLDMLTAAGLLRLAVDPSWNRTAGAAGVLLVRLLAGVGLRARQASPGLAARMR